MPGQLLDYSETHLRQLPDGEVHRLVEHGLDLRPCRRYEVLPTAVADDDLPVGVEVFQRRDRITLDNAPDHTVSP